MAAETIDFRVPEDLFERYDQLAKSTGRTKIFYVMEALSNSIDRLEYECEILKQVEDYRAGKLKTYSLDEVAEHCGLDRY